jgi:class 3 adenylate cyclase/phosphoglycerate-specific signal transduction histidine kinase
MNGANQGPPGAGYVEAHTSNLASAGRKQDSKPALGIKAKLFLAFGGMAMLTVGASAVAWYAFTDVERLVTRISAESVADMVISLRLAEKSAELTATAPALIASRNEEERVREQKRLTQRLNELSALTEGLKATSVADARRANLIEIEAKIANELKALNGAVERRLRLSAQRETAIADLGAVHARFQDALVPLVDDAGFDVVTASEEVAANSKKAITDLVEGGVNALQVLLTLRAEGNLAAGLLAEAAHVDDPALIQPIRERFSAAAATTERSLKALHPAPDNEQLRQASETLIALGGGADNIFEARSQELRALAETRRSLQAKREGLAAAVEVAHRSLLETLTPMVDDAGFELVTASEEVAANSKKAITDLVEGGVNALQVLLTLRAEGNLAAGLLAEAAHVDDPALIQPIRERFSAAAATIERSLKALHPAPDNEQLREASTTLIALGGGADNIFEARSQELRALAETRYSLQAKREGLVAAVEVAHRTLLETLTPMVDDAGFHLVTTSEEVTAKSSEALTGLVEGGVNTLQMLLTLRAEGNLAAGLLNQAAGAGDSSSLRPLQERFVAAASRAQKLLSQLPASVDNGALRGLTETLTAFGTSAENIFVLRQEELRQIAAAQVFLEASNALVLDLGKEVAELVLAARNSSDATALRTARAIGSGQILLIFITALSVVGAAVISMLYVVPRVVRPIEKITAAMSGLAAGDTSIDVPGRDRSDEIGRMAEALGVFRDTAIEIQGSNEREIREGRRRLAVAIESISEAFSLYDGEDRLVVCNNKYRTLLYPSGAPEISPGMTFESIIRRAAEHGYVKDAEGRTEEWIRERMTRHRGPGGPHVQQRGDGRWILVSERKTDDRSTVAVYSDITELKQRENQLAEKSKALEQLSSQLAKYLSPQVYESIFSGKQEVKIASRRKKLSVFFSDIAGFTETTDRLESEDLTQLLNHYLTEMSEIALFYGATIDKYVGDAIVIFFGDPETRGVKEDAVACVEMAIAMRSKMRELQSVWRTWGIEKPLQCRIGINTGYCTVGNFGSEDRMDYTIIGGGVNLASRLEAAAIPGEILMSYETYANVRHRIHCEQRGHISVKGIAYPVSTYQVVDTYENLGTERQFIHEERPNLRLDLDLDSMSNDDRSHAAAVLRDALNRLSAIDQATTPGP